MPRPPVITKEEISVELLAFVYLVCLPFSDDFLSQGTLKKSNLNFLNVLKMQSVLVSVFILSKWFILKWLSSTEKHLE